LARIITEGTGNSTAILNYLKESLKQQSVEGEYAYILWTAETADHVYEVGTDTFVVRNGKIVTQSFTGKITPKG
jgi:branched-subunit amino acid aminotransferase/4-amino-4-deoxychorismate lyase